MAGDVTFPTLSFLKKEKNLREPHPQICEIEMSTVVHSVFSVPFLEEDSRVDSANSGSRTQKPRLMEKSGTHHLHRLRPFVILDFLPKTSTGAH
jgi:hypothetical protein